MIPQDVLADLLQSEYGTQRTEAEAAAARMLCKAYRRMQGETTNATSLVAAVSLVETFLRKDLRHEVHLGHYYALAVSPAGNIQGFSDKTNFRLADALIKMAAKLPV